MIRTAAVVLLLAIAAGGGCGDTPPEQAKRCELPESADDLKLLPRDLPLDDWATVDRIDVEGGFLGARGVTRTQIVELYPVIARAITASNHTILSGDNEGFEAEIYFERGEGTTGTVSMREGPCGELVTVHLLYEAPRYRRVS